MAAAVQIRDVVKRYGTFRALDGVSLDIGAGEFVTLLGPSGSGKTTLLMSVAGFAAPDSGSIVVGGREMLAVEPNHRNIGMVFQSYALFPHMSVGQNIAYPLRLRGVPKAEREERCRKVLAAVQMAGYEDRRIDQLSGGQRQRIAVARAIVFEPAIILMDEPLSALDKKLREELQMELKHLHGRLGSTIIYVTHDQTEALTLSDRIAVMNRGAIVQVATPKEMYERPATAFVADFIGNSQLVPITSAETGSTDGGAVDGLSGRTDVALVVRPEKLDLVGAQERRPGSFLFSGTVSEVVYQGEASLVHVTLAGGGTIVARRDSRAASQSAIPAPGEPIRLALDRADACVVPLDGGRG